MPEATLGEQLRRSRRSKGLTLRELAAEVGLSPSLLSQVENGRTRLSAGNLELLMNALDIAPSDLFVTRNGVALDAAAPAPAPVHEDIVVPGTAGGVINRAGTRPSRAMAGGLAMERLPTSVGHLLDPLLMTYPPGASSAFEGRGGGVGVESVLELCHALGVGAV